jgi:hypothetical protein
MQHINSNHEINQQLARQATRYIPLFVELDASFSQTTYSYTPQKHLRGV